MLVDMTTTTLTQDSATDLARRESDGFEVTLFWWPGSGRLTVCVCDHRRGAYLEIPAEPGRALDVYYHPFAYRDFSTVDYEDIRLAA
jgi:hypothetical protein